MLLAIPLGLAIGLAVGLLGGGGSVLAVPVLVYVLGEDVETATTVSLVVVAAAAFAGAYGYARGGDVCWRHAAVFTIAAVPGIVAGTALGDVIGGSAFLLAFAAVMLVAARATWRKAAAEESGTTEPPATCPALRVGRDAAIGLGVGLLTGFFGVGGGFVVVPALMLALAFSMRRAVGTSLVIIAATSAIGALVHLGAGRHVELDLTLALAATCVVGAIAGSRLSAQIAQETLGRAFAGLVLAVATYLLVSAAFLGGPPSS